MCVQLHASGSFNVKHGLPIARPKKLFILSDRPPQFLGVKFVLCGLHNLGCWLFSNRDSTKPWLPPQDNINNIPKYCSLAIRACHLHSKFSCATPQWYTAHGSSLQKMDMLNFSILLKHSKIILVDSSHFCLYFGIIVLGTWEQRLFESPSPALGCSMGTKGLKMAYPIPRIGIFRMIGF